MYDFITGKYRGLSQLEESAAAFGMDLKQVREMESKRDEHYKKISLEADRDLRFSTKSKAKKVTAEERKAYEDRVHAGGGKTLKDLLKEQGD